MSNTSTGKSLLGEVEQLVLLAVLKLDSGAYADALRDVIGRDAGVRLSRGSMYVTLERLELKGYLSSWFSEPQAVRGGKARRLFKVKPSGVAALKSAKRGFDRLAAGTLLGAVDARKP